MMKAMFNIVQDAMYYFIDTYGVPWHTLNVKIKVRPNILHVTNDMWQTLSMTFPGISSWNL